MRPVDNQPLSDWSVRARGSRIFECRTIDLEAGLPHEVLQMLHAPMCFELDLYALHHPTACGNYGGIGRLVDGHEVLSKLDVTFEIIRDPEVSTELSASGVPKHMHVRGDLFR